MKRTTFVGAAVLCFAISACSPAPQENYDLIISGGTVYDGEGGPGVIADVGVKGDRVAAVGDLHKARATETVDASGMAVAPGFINTLSWAVESLIEDGRGLSDLRQGVTLEVFGEGVSMGPLNGAMKQETQESQGDIKYDVEWNTLGEYLDFLVKKGVSPNVASFVGATTVRIHEIGYEDRAPTPEELARMQDLVREAMREGALGVGSSIIYPPAFFAKTDELVALTKAASEFGGGYITHMRSESEDIFDAIDETITIAREANTRAQIYHLKLSGRSNWDKQAELIERLNAARADGVDITADVYTYTAGATGLDASLPPWVQEGGDKAMRDRLKDPAIRKKVIEEMRVDSVGWENLLRQADGPEKVLLVSFRTDALKPLTGKTLAEVAAMRGTSPEDTVIDLMLEDESRVGTIYFLMNEENVRNNIEWPYTMFGSDEEAPAPEGVFLKANPHPRAYGNFARVFAKYVRDEGVISVAEAVRRMTSLSADELGVKERGRLKPGNYADIVIFDPATIQDHATYEKPHQLATGVRDVFVNGVAVLRDEQHTGAMPGRVVRGPGWVGEAEAGGE